MIKTRETEARCCLLTRSKQKISTVPFHGPLVSLTRSAIWISHTSNTRSVYHHLAVAVILLGGPLNTADPSHLYVMIEAPEINSFVGATLALQSVGSER